MDDRATPLPPSSADAAIADRFSASMPEAYRLRYARAQILEHARIVRARGEALVHVATASSEPAPDPDAEWICVVTDDRPGLLSLLSAAVSAHSLDILAARIYIRSRRGLSVEGTAEGPGEAVDFFAVRRLKGEAGALVSSDLVAIGLSIENLLRGETNVEWLERRASPTSRPAAETETSVRFLGEEGSELLVVESRDRPGLLMTITLALYREGLTIVRSHVSTSHASSGGASARDEFEVAEKDGSRLTPERKAAVIASVRTALARTKRDEGEKG